MTEISYNNVLVGEVDNPSTFVKKIIKRRRSGKFPKELNVRFNELEDKVEIFTEKGRARRPIIIVEEGKSLVTKEILAKLKKKELSFTDLENKGIVEYLDTDEEENSLVALTEKDITLDHTHVEINPIIIVGIMTGMVPYSEFNQAPRVSFGSKLQKQSLGVYAQNFHLRQDTDTHVMHYTQTPIVNTIMDVRQDFIDHPAGQNVTVAIMSFKGYNSADGIVINKSSLQRGLFRSTYFKPYKNVELRYLGGQVDLFEIPDKEVRGYRSEEDYNHLDDDGLISPESVVRKGEVIIGKTAPPRFLAESEEFRFGMEARRDASVNIEEPIAIVDGVFLTETEEGNKYVKVKLRMDRIPEIADKFSSRSGQKGVIGMIVDEADMPRTRDGVVPDIIFNPHGIPSRMTVSYLLEVLGGKAGAISGQKINGTTFNGVTEEEMSKMLLEQGFRADGAEAMYDGITGEEFAAKIMVGNAYYMRLKYMSGSKLHARGRGPMQLLTRQPTEGRSKGGGLRLGEMEKDVIVAHGASLLLKERFDSDKTLVPICSNCGLVAIHNTYRNESVCPNCKDAVVKIIEMSYAFKLLLDELRSLNIYPKLVLGSKQK